ncbi:uncharacterized protein BROUX77_002017 [Berkeleyomyces rouxiae]|uniref:uncharacterized protein n=1 Tax=Berkeleyomyces rouxiae TaxID=2035830 RepID=UPI003B7DF529
MSSPPHLTGSSISLARPSGTPAGLLAPATGEPAPKKRKVGSKACDGCKVRKVRCSGTPSCERCTAVGIACTFNKLQATRGPRNLRPKTLRQIESLQTQTQHLEKAAGNEATHDSGQSACPGVLPGPPLDQQRHGEPSVSINTHGPVLQSPSSPETVPSPVPATARWSSASMPLPQRTPVETLVLRLCIYRMRLFPVWPIVAVEEIIASLQIDSGNLATYALANAIGAATMAQLKLQRANNPEITDNVVAADMAAECQWARAQLEIEETQAAERTIAPDSASESRAQAEYDADANSLDALRTSFFLHVYQENLQPGGRTSLLFLREAITLAQLMGLGRASSYVGPSEQEQRMRRRIIWLLFVTERGVALLHKLPVVLTAPKRFPPLDLVEGDVGWAGCGDAGPVGGDAHNDRRGSAAEDHGSAHFLPAFRQLVNLFWIFDQSGALEALQNDESRPSSASESPPASRAENLDANTGIVANTTAFRALQQRLRDIPLGTEFSGNDIQRADLLVTRQWMQILLWRAVVAHSATNFQQPNSSPAHVSTPALALGPLQIAGEFLQLIASVPRSALDAHGPSLEYKVYEISRAVTDTLMARSLHDPVALGHVVAPLTSPPSSPRQNPEKVLHELQQLLASCRGGNSHLVQRLRAQIAQVQPAALSVSAGDWFSPLSLVAPGLRSRPVATTVAGAGQGFVTPNMALAWSDSMAAAAALENVNINLDSMLGLGMGMGASSATRLGVGLGGLGVNHWYYQVLDPDLTSNSVDQNQHHP